MIILTPEQMNRLDEYVINKLNIPGTVLMEHAALAVAEKVEKMVEGIPEPKAVLFVGTGNNGGDGFAAARILESKGIKTVTCLFGDPEKIKGDARVNYDIHKAMGLTLLEYGKDRHEEFVRNVQEADLAVDALMGTGFSGTPRYPIDEAIHILNGYAKKVLSVISLRSQRNGRQRKHLLRSSGRNRYLLLPEARAVSLSRKRHGRQRDRRTHTNTQASRGTDEQHHAFCGCGLGKRMAAFKEGGRE